MNYNKYKRGSEWRKWDLHVHTPFTKLNDQYKDHQKTDDEIWDLFCERIEQSDVFVFGITDYFSIDNYFTFIDKFKNKYPDSQKVFFPNIEFRIDSKNSNNEHVQFHVIFSNEQTILDKLNNFFIRLKLVSTDDKNLANKYCTDTDLNGITYNKAMVEISALEKKLKDDFAKDGYLIGGVANGYGSLRPNGHNNGRGAEYAKELDKKCKIFFGNSRNTDFFLNKISGRKLYNLPPKPVLFGCDAHSFDVLNKKLGKTFEEKNESEEIVDYSETVWIKADPTFEGLKQIVYEPANRLKIQELKPEEKRGYQAIDKVKFIDGSFTTDEILINQNLTTIIGGKSTGKSVLLRNIAQTIDFKEVENRLEVGIDPYLKEVSDFRVVWKDEQKNKKGEVDGANRKIIYIPQSYLNRLVDEKEDKTSIDDIIKDVLGQENDVREVFANLENSKRETEKILTQNIEDLFYEKRDIKELSEDIKKIGDKKGIEVEIEKLKKEISELKKKSGMTEVEIKKYDELITESVKLKNQKILYQNDLKALGNIKNQKIFIIPIFDDLSENLQKILSSEFFQITEKYQSEWTTKLNEKIVIFQKDDLENDKKIIENDGNLRPLLRKVIESEALDEKIKKSEEEEKKLRVISEQENDLLKLKSNYEKLIEDISENHSRFYDELFNAKTAILKQRIITGELEFGIDITPKDKTFGKDFIKDVCNLTILANFENGFLNNYKIPNEQVRFKKDIEKIISGILKDRLKLVKKYSKKEAITRLVRNWFIFDYKIKQNGDEIAEMSPGKKSFVLLKLLIELDNSKCPILLDQPEDDLDNRSIYDELVQFIKAKKKERQIIIATHNPNLVVGADAELVIVANQKGDKSKNKTYDFEYVEGALENTFINKNIEEILYKQGIQEHVCDILEGGKKAFEQRKRKYNLNK